MILLELPIDVSLFMLLLGIVVIVIGAGAFMLGKFMDPFWKCAQYRRYLKSNHMVIAVLKNDMRRFIFYVVNTENATFKLNTHRWFVEKEKVYVVAEDDKRISKKEALGQKNMKFEITKDRTLEFSGVPVYFVCVDDAGGLTPYTYPMRKERVLQDDGTFKEREVPAGILFENRATSDQMSAIFDSAVGVEKAKQFKEQADMKKMLMYLLIGLIIVGLAAGFAAFKGNESADKLTQLDAKVSSYINSTTQTTTTTTGTPTHTTTAPSGGVVVYQNGKPVTG